MKAAILAFVLLLGFIGPASASYLPKGTGHTVSKSGNTGTVGHGSLLDEIISQGKPPSMLDQIIQDRGRGSLLDDAISDHYRNGKGGQGPAELKSKLPNPHAPPWEKDPTKGKFDAKTPISAGKVAKALRGGVVPYLAGHLLEEIIEAACVRLAGGTLEMADHGQWQECHQGPPPDPNWEYASGRQPAPKTWFGSAEQACGLGFQLLNSSLPSGSTQSYHFTHVDYQNTRCAGKHRDSRYPTQNLDTYESLQKRPRQGPPVEDVEWRDIPTQDAEDKIKEEIEKPGNGPKVADAIKDYLDKGGEFEPDSPPQVSGPPQSSPSSQTTTSTSTDPATGQTTTITTTTNTVNNYTYNNSTVINNQTTTTTKTDGEGKVIESSTTTTNPSDKEEPPPTDTPLPDLPKLYERKYPDGMTGIWNEKSEALKQTPLFTLAEQLMPTDISGGSCPSWQIPLDMAGFHSWGVADVSPPCWIWDFGKVVILIGALILARALIFGG